MGSACDDWFRVVYDVRVTHPTNDLQYVHELVSGIDRDLFGVTLVRVHVEGTRTGVNDDTGQILIILIVKGVIRGVVLGTHGWSVLDSLIIGYQGSPVKRGCASSCKVLKGPLIHDVLERRI